MSTLGLYLHIPFCLSKCAYCDFCSFPAVDSDTRHRYAEALAREISARAPAYRDRCVDTVFFGGGTPTLLSNEDLSMLADAIASHFCICEDAEWSIECNPATADAEKFRVLRESGFNRLSIGMQSACDGELSHLGRAHRQSDLISAVRDARDGGFTNINLDLMFGIPAQTRESFSRTLDEALALAPTHLSVYSLQIEEGTPFYEKRTALPLPDEDEEREMAARLAERLHAAGYHRYEISNYAKEGYECRHNLRYWQMQDYLGLGLAAHSLVGDRRFYNGEDLSAYLADPLSILCEEERLDDAAREFETIMLGLRLARGISETTFSQAFGYGFFEKYGARLAPFLEAGLVCTDKTRTYLTDAGMALSNTILSEILD